MSPQGSVRAGVSKAAYTCLSELVHPGVWLDMISGEAVMVRKAMREADKLEERDLALFVYGRGSEMKDELCQRRPEFPSDSLMPIPNRDVQTLAFHPPVAEQSEKILSWCNANSRGVAGSRLAAVLAADWKSKHLLISHDDCERVATLPNDRSRCCDAAMCLCSPSGKRVFRFRNRLLLGLKHLCKHGTDDKKELATGNVFVLLRGYSIDGGAGVVGLAGDAGDEQCQQEVVVHVSAMYLSPYRPTFHLVEILGKIESTYQLRATTDFCVEYDLYSGLDLDTMRWTLSLLSLHRSKRPIGELDPRFVQAGPFEGRFGDHEWQLWTTRMARRPRAAPPAAADGGGPVDGAVGDVPGDSMADSGSDNNSQGCPEDGDVNAVDGGGAASSAPSEVASGPSFQCYFGGFCVFQFMLVSGCACLGFELMVVQVWFCTIVICVVWCVFCVISTGCCRRPRGRSGLGVHHWPGGA